MLFVFDRILDMSRTAVNVFGDSCGAVTIARLEGETGILGKETALRSPPRRGRLSSPQQPGLRLVRERRTVALFKPEAPPRELLLAAVDAARWAPNHHLTEPWRFYLLGSKALRAMIDIAEELTLAKRGAGAAKTRRKLLDAVPEWMAVTCRRSEDAFREREDYGACCCAIQNCMLCLWGERPGLQVEHGRGDAG